MTNEAIEIQNDGGYPVSANALIDAARATLAQHNAAGCSLTLVISDSATVQDLNRQFRGVDAPTDVLSFPADDMPPAPDDVPDSPRYVGDIIIAYPYTAAAAQRAGHDIAGTLTLLTVHGTLHLLGFDHDTDANRAVMWRHQRDICAALGVAEAIIPTLEGLDDD